MRIRGLGRLQRWKQAWKRKRQRGTIILAYHRVIERELDPLLVCVSPRNFADHLALLVKRFRVIPLQTAVQNIPQGKTSRRAVVITFDDGYADNLHEAKPLLHRYHLPATVFVTAGVVQHSQEFWWSVLERILLHPGDLPPHCSLEIHGTAYSWQLGVSTHYTHADYQNYRTWNIQVHENPTPRHQIYRELFFALYHLPFTEQHGILQQLLEWAGLAPPPQEQDRPLTSCELERLTAGGLIEVGAHTMTHPVLAALKTTEQQQEIVRSKQTLETWLKHPVTSFAYPYGTRSDYTGETVEMVRQAGFECACSNFPGTIRTDTDSFQLPRFLVRDWPVQELEAWLNHWFEG